MSSLDYRIELPEEIVSLLDDIAGDTLEKKIKIALSINLHLNNTISLEKAAELAEESTEDYIKILTDQGIPWLEYTEQQKKQDDKVINKAKKELGLQ